MSDIQEQENSPYRVHWTDLPSILLVLALLGGFLAITIIDLQDFSTTKCYLTDFTDPLKAFINPIMLLVVAISSLSAIVLSILYYSSILLCYEYFITTAVVLQTLVCTASTVVYLVQQRWLSGAINVLWIIISAIFYWVLISHKRMVNLNLKIVSHFIRMNFTLIILSAFSALFVAGWSVLVGAVLIAGLSKTISVDCVAGDVTRPQGQFLGLLVLVLICNYVAVELVKGAMRSTTAAAFGDWLYGNTYNPNSSNARPHIDNFVNEFEPRPGVVLTGLVTSLTSSLGSLCLSAMWLALVRILAQVVGAWSQELIVNPVGEGGVPTTQDVSVILLAWMLSNIVWCLDSLISHFTGYVIIFVSTENDSCFQAIRKTYHLIIQEGFDTVVNAVLSSGAMNFASWCVATLCALFVHIYMRWIANYPIEGIYFTTLYTFMACMQTSMTFMASISSASQTLYVGYCTDPAIIEETHPHIYEELQAEKHR